MKDKSNWIYGIGEELFSYDNKKKRSNGNVWKTGHRKMFLRSLQVGIDNLMGIRMQCSTEPFESTYLQSRKLGKLWKATLFVLKKVGGQSP